MPKSRPPYPAEFRQQIIELAQAGRSPAGLAREFTIIQSILAGQQPRCMSLLWFQRNPLPTDWAGQRTVVAGFDA